MPQPTEAAGPGTLPGRALQGHGCTQRARSTSFRPPKGPHAAARPGPDPGRCSSQRSPGAPQAATPAPRHSSKEEEEEEEDLGCKPVQSQLRSAPPQQTCSLGRSAARPGTADAFQGGICTTVLVFFYPGARPQNPRVSTQNPALPAPGKVSQGPQPPCPSEVAIRRRPTPGAGASSTEKGCCCAAGRGLGREEGKQPQQKPTLSFHKTAEFISLQPFTSVSSYKMKEALKNRGDEIKPSVLGSWHLCHCHCHHGRNNDRDCFCICVRARVHGEEEGGGRCTPAPPPPSLGASAPTWLPAAQDQLATHTRASPVGTSAVMARSGDDFSSATRGAGAYRPAPGPGGRWLKLIKTCGWRRSFDPCSFHITWLCCSDYCRAAPAGAAPRGELGAAGPEPALPSLHRVTIKQKA